MSTTFVLVPIDLLDVLTRVSEYLDDRADVRDGQDGPLPNEAM